LAELNVLGLSPNRCSHQVLPRREFRASLEGKPGCADDILDAKLLDFIHARIVTLFGIA
jgi:hypothetical protein